MKGMLIHRTHYWQSHWIHELGQFICKTCGKAPVDCKGMIKIG